MIEVSWYNGFMAKSKTRFSLKELESLTAEEIIDKIQNENYSLLASFGAEKLRKEMVPVGRACNVAVNYFFASTGPKSNRIKHDLAAQKKLVKLLSKLTPGTYHGVTKGSHGLVVGFNHPSLGEIGRIMAMKTAVMGDKPTCFPVNLPWYEALAPNYERIRRLGFIITPTITPSTWTKMELKEGTKLFAAGERLKKEFRDIYTDLSHDLVKQGGVIFVAPSATRQATVFRDEAVFNHEEDIIPTMSVLALKLFVDPELNCDFLPLAILPPRDYKRGLNFGKKYKLIPGEVMTNDYIRKTYFKNPHPKRLEGFDYEFHRRIADKLPKEFWY